MNQSERINIVRGMLLSVTSPSGTINELRRSPRGTRCCTIQYAFQGRPVCLNVFSAIVNLSTETVTRHAQEVLSSTAVNFYTVNRSDSRKDKPAPQTVVLCAFLEQFSDTHGFPDPSPSALSRKNICRYLPSSFTYRSVYNLYLHDWNRIGSRAVQLD